MTRWSWARWALVLSFVGGSLVGFPAHATPTSVLQIETLSNRADLISGGDALVQIDLPSGADTATVELNGSDISNEFAVRPNGQFQGIVTGMHDGANTVTARAGGQVAQLTITNHPIGGPVFSGPQVQPWYCMADALDAQCDRPITYTWDYMSSVTGKFATYDPNNPPADLATTTTDQGKTVPYIVRVENGDIDRGQYAIAMLYDGSAPFSRWTGGPPAWNHKVYEFYGAGCSTSHEEGPTPDVLQGVALSKGFAVMSTAMSDQDYDCNLAVQAESIMMAKEHLIETYGDVRYLFGYGCSGGSIASLQIANAYPGLINGVMVYCTMPDEPINDLLDCAEFMHYFETPQNWSPGVVWPENQQAAATGMASTSVCHAWVEAYHYPEVFQPKTGVGCRVTVNNPELVYNAATNPGGLRCSLQDYMSNIFGFRSPDAWGAVEKQIGHGFAGRPYDNVGVQYGLRPLMNGTISPAQFVDLNSKIGSLDIDYNFQPGRVTGDPFAIQAAYRSGFVDEGNNLAQVPIIDTPGYVPGDRYEIHDNTKSWALRARLDHFNGNHDAQVLWYGMEGRFQNNFGTMDSWLSSVEADQRPLTLVQKVDADKPAAAQDQCYYPDQGRICDTLFGPAGNPRWASGGSIAEDVLKCQLKPLVRSQYAPILFSDAEWAQMQRTFPTGVCDWSKQGVSQQPNLGWMDYTNQLGGEPLGPAPQSVLLQG